MPDAAHRTCTELIETGTEPEYFITHLAKAEPLKNGLMRLYIASERRDHLRLEYTVVVSPRELAEMCRAGLLIAADMHNLFMFQSDMTKN